MWSDLGFYNSFLTIPGIGSIVAAGPLLAALTGAGIGAVAGGLIGALTDVGVPEEEAGYYVEGVRRGGTLVTVRADEAQVDRAVEILERHGAIDVDQRAAAWRQSGWTGYSPTAEPYTADKVRQERERYRSAPTRELPSAVGPVPGRPRSRPARL